MADLLTARGKGFYRTVGTERFFYIFFTFGEVFGCQSPPCCLSTGLVWALGFAPPGLSTGQQPSHYLYSCTHSKPCDEHHFALSVLSGVIFLVWKIKTANIVAHAIAPIGFIFCVISLLTGSIWAKPTLGYLLGLGCTPNLHADFGVLYAGVIALFSALK